MDIEHMTSGRSEGNTVQIHANHGVINIVTSKAKAVTKAYIVQDGLLPNFTGRDAELLEIESVFAGTSIRKATQCIVYGMPGIGKTQLALKYATMAKNFRSFVFWVSGARLDQLNSTCLRILEAVGEQADADRDTNTYRLRVWLEEHLDWLLVIDDVNPATLCYVRDVLLPNSNDDGNILITTRFSHVAQSFAAQDGPQTHLLELQVMASEDAIQLFHSSKTMSHHLDYYTVGILCAVPTEYAIAIALLDQEFTRVEDIPKYDNNRDINSYTFGRFHQHGIVITCLSKGRNGTTSAAVITDRMRSTFSTSLRFVLMIGIAGGAPSKKNDIRLGDVVVSSPHSIYGGVIQYDYGKMLQEKTFLQTGFQAAPPEILLNAVSTIIAQYKRQTSRITDTINDLLEKSSLSNQEYSRPDKKTDRLCKADYIHKEDSQCACLSFDKSIKVEQNFSLVYREERGHNDPVVHYGLIASANQVMKDAVTRDILIQKYDVLCFEMEAAGSMNYFPCLIIRGICDYSDSHKNNIWQGYAAAAATAYAKTLLEIIPGIETESVLPQNKNIPTMQLTGLKYDYRSFRVPFSLRQLPLVKRFIGRSKEMEVLEKALLPGMELKKRRRVFVLWGLGGIGKTQLAVEFMREHHSKYSATFWVDGSSKDSLEKDLEIHGTRIPSYDRNYLPKTSDHKTEAQAMLDWLAIPENSEWLLVIDNADREWSLECKDSQAYDIQQYFPDADHGSILLTTRLVTMHQIGNSREVQKVDERDGEEILKSWYEADFDSADGSRLLRCLGGLPLAIAQAAAYLQESGNNIKRYLRLYESKDDDTRQLRSTWKTPLLGYPNKTLDTTWKLSYEAVHNLDEHFSNMLILWSYLNQNDLWFGMFDLAIKYPKDETERNLFIQALTECVGKAAVEESSFHYTMEQLRRYSLIEGYNEVEGYVMHPMVHQWIYLYQGCSRPDIGMLALTVAGLGTPVSTAIDCVRLQLRMSLHVQICSDRMLRNPQKFDDQILTLTATEERRNVLNGARRLGDCFYLISKFEQAEQVYLQVIKSSEKLLGPNQEPGLIAMFTLGHVYRRQHNLSKAQKEYEQALEGQEVLLGPTHLTTLRTRKNLALIYGELNMLDKAHELYSRLLEELEANYNPEHELCLSVCENLGMLHLKQNNTERAEQLLSRAYLGFKKLHGKTHMTTLEATHHLGNLYSAKGDFVRAEELYRLSLNGYRETLGVAAMSGYVEALVAMVSLGELCARLGRIEEAKDMFRQALYGYKRLQGVSLERCSELEHMLDKLDIIKDTP